MLVSLLSPRVTAVQCRAGAGQAVLCMLCWTCCALHAVLLVGSRVMPGSGHAVGTASECRDTKACSMDACCLLEGGTQPSCDTTRKQLLCTARLWAVLTELPGPSSAFQCTDPIQLCCSFPCFYVAPVAAAAWKSLGVREAGGEGGEGQCVEGLKGHGGYVSCEGGCWNEQGCCNVQGAVLAGCGASCDAGSAHAGAGGLPLLPLADPIPSALPPPRAAGAAHRPGCHCAGRCK